MGTLGFLEFQRARCRREYPPGAKCPEKGLQETGSDAFFRDISGHENMGFPEAVALKAVTAAGEVTETKFPYPL